MYCVNLKENGDLTLDYWFGSKELCPTTSTSTSRKRTTVILGRKG